MIVPAKLFSSSYDSKLVPLFSQFIFYYSGHGKNMNGQTVGIDSDGEPIYLEKLLYDISKLKNTTIIGFFDCCRENEKIPQNVPKGGSSKNLENHLGRYVIFYPTSLGMKTYAGESSSIASD
jgi:hypothetical protein